MKTIEEGNESFKFLTDFANQYIGNKDTNSNNNKLKKKIKYWIIIRDSNISKLKTTGRQRNIMENYMRL